MRPSFASSISKSYNSPVDTEQRSGGADSVKEILEHLKKAREALKDRDLNTVSWYLTLAERHAHSLRELFEQDPEGGRSPNPK